jgi:Mg-chelatase subunit ChlD
VVSEPPALAERAVAVAGWLRAHPDVEAGPSVRAAIAFADLAGRWRELAGSDDLLPPALVALAHRLRVRPGADADELVRLALLDTAGAGEAVESDEQRRPEASQPAHGFDVAVVSRMHAPGRPDVPPEHRHYGDDEARRLIDELFPAGPPEPAGPGVVPTRPGRRGMGDEALAPRPVRSGDRARELSVRASVRAALRTPGRRAGAGNCESGSTSAVPADSQNGISVTPGHLRTAPRQPVAAYDVVLVLDASASMGAAERPVVVPAATALARALVRAGHRVGAVAFSEEAVVARALSRAPDPLPGEGYAFAHATNVEAGIDAGRILLHRQGDPDARPNLLLLTDAEATSHSGSDEAWGPDGPPLGMAGFNRLLQGAGADAARRAALLAATRARRAGITVSVIYPDDRADVAFAHTLAAAGGGQARRLR